MAIIEKIIIIPLYQRLIALAVIVFILLGGFYFLSYKPKNNTIKELNASLDKLQSELLDLNTIAKQLPEFKKMSEKLQAELELAQKQLPKLKEIPALLTTISNIITQQGLALPLFKQGREKQKDFYAEVPISIKITGPYHNIALFFDQISKLPRIVNISNIKIGGAKSKDGYTIMQTDCLATTYRFLEQSEIKIDNKKK